MNVASLLVAAAGRHPDRPAWVHAARGASYRELADRVARLAGGLTSRFPPGSRVLLVLTNGPEFVEVLWATFRAGMVAVPVNRHLAAAEIGHVLRHSGASAAFVDDRTRDVVAEAAADLPDVVLVDVGSADFPALGAGQPTGLAEVAPDDPAWLFYTSGTTGRPKGATLSHRNLLAMTLNYLADVDPLGPDAVCLHAAPLSHGSGLYLLPALARGALNVIAPGGSFEPDRFLALVDEHAVTHAIFLAPTMLRRLTDAARATGWSSASLRHVMVGGAALYEQDLADAIDAFGPMVNQVYGQGESPMTITVMPAGLLTTRTAPGTNWRSCGRPFTAVEVRIGDGSGPGVDGEVRVRGDVVMRGYRDDPDATARALSGGWLATGDIGHLDEHGFLYLTDRSKDVIISGGSNIYPREVEEALLVHPAVHEAVVVGVPDPEWGESVRAYVVPVDGTEVDEPALIAHCRGLIASFKKPRSVVFLDELPKSANGKVLRRVLRAAAGQPS